MGGARRYHHHHYIHFTAEGIFSNCGSRQCRKHFVVREASPSTMVKVVLTVELEQGEANIAEAVKMAAEAVLAASNRCETGSLSLNGSWAPWDMQVPADGVITFSVLTGILKHSPNREESDDDDDDEPEPEAKKSKSSSSGDKID